MNRLERIELYARVEKAEQTVVAFKQIIDELTTRIVALETKPRLGRPPKATDGEGLQQPS